MYRLIGQKPAHFLSAQMALVSTFFQKFIVLGMYNFGLGLEILGMKCNATADKVYMSFVQATTGGGGWPMSVFLTPTLKPIYGGTYFPPEDQVS